MVVVSYDVKQQQTAMMTSRTAAAARGGFAFPLLSKPHQLRQVLDEGVYQGPVTKHARRCVVAGVDAEPAQPIGGEKKPGEGP